MPLKLGSLARKLQNSKKRAPLTHGARSDMAPSTRGLATYVGPGSTFSSCAPGATAPSGETWPGPSSGAVCGGDVLLTAGALYPEAELRASALLPSLRAAHIRGSK
jgi:hypothetical protein